MNRFVRIYGRYKGTRKFIPFDYRNGVFVKDLIYASYWDICHEDKVKEYVKYMNEHNQDCEFEIRYSN